VSAQPLLQAQGLGKRYGERWVLRGLDLSVARGECVALLGESGCGKSTLLNLLAGLDRCDEGRVRIDGTDLAELSQDQAARFRSRTIGFVFQAFHLLAHLSAERNVAVPLLLTGCALPQALAQARQALARVGLAHRAQALAVQLSGGEQQRVALVRALVHRPALVLADEPTGNLDPATARDALELMRTELAAHGAALVMVTHSNAASAITDRQLTLQSGVLTPAN
jgi:putative ABC transport system ATP-binding protein